MITVEDAKKLLDEAASEHGDMRGVRKLRDAAPDLARALLDARTELAAAQQREAGLVERAEKAEAERDKWFEGAGAHHVASMQQAQRADIAEAELAAIRNGETS